MNEKIKKQLGIVSPCEKWLWADLPKVKCPYCGYEMPIIYTPDTAECWGVFVRCKGRQCRKMFEIKISTK